jgi:hypothetical protein
LLGAVLRDSGRDIVAVKVPRATYMLLQRDTVLVSSLFGKNHDALNHSPRNIEGSRIERIAING